MIKKSMKTSQFPRADIWHIINCLMVSIVLAVMAVYTYPLVMKIVAPLDAIILPPSLQGLKPSSVLIGVLATSIFSAIPALARGLAPDWKYIANRD